MASRYANNLSEFYRVQPPNNSLQRTGDQRGRTVRAAALLRGPVRMGIVPAAERDR